MLGFNTLSETAFAEASVVLAAFGYLGSASATGDATNLDYNAVAFRSVSAVSATSEVGVDPDAQATVNIGSTSADSFVEPFQGVEAQASIVYGSVIATSATNSITSLAKANTLQDSIHVDITAGVVNLDAKANINLSDASLSLSSPGTLEPSGTAETSLVGQQASVDTGNLLTLSVVFPFENYADSYNRDRTVTIRNMTGSNTVYIR